MNCKLNHLWFRNTLSRRMDAPSCSIPEKVIQSCATRRLFSLSGAVTSIRAKGKNEYEFSCQFSQRFNYANIKVPQVCFISSKQEEPNMRRWWSDGSHPSTLVTNNGKGFQKKLQGLRWQLIPQLKTSRCGQQKAKLKTKKQVRKIERTLVQNSPLRT